MTAEERCRKRVSPWMLFNAVSCVITCFLSNILRQPYSVGATIQHVILQNKKGKPKYSINMVFLNCNKNCQGTD